MPSASSPNTPPPEAVPKPRPQSAKPTAPVAATPRRPGRTHARLGPTPTLRERAEATLTPSPTAPAQRSPAESQRLVHELQVHHIELEMQNEELRRAQAELGESRDHFHQLYDFAPVGYVTLTPDGSVREANHRLTTLLGIPRGKLVGRKFTAFVPPQAQDALYLHLRAALDHEVKQACELNLRRADRTTFAARLETVVLQNTVSGVRYHLIAVTDITERQQAEAQRRQFNTELEQRVTERTRELRAAVTELEQEMAERKRLELEILDISEREQRKFGFDLHDGLGQELTGLSMLSHALGEDLQGHAPALTQHARRLSQGLSLAVTHARQLSHGLAPVALKGEGLMRGLQELVASTSQRAGVTCRFRCPSPVQIQDITTATNLYRIAQEAVNNALKHGRAKRIDLRLTARADQVELSVANNGCPLPPAPSVTGGIGLHLMRYRAEAIGARLTIKSGKDKGVRVTCILPRKKQENMTSPARAEAAHPARGRSSHDARGPRPQHRSAAQ